MKKTENDRYTQGEGDYLTQGTFAFRFIIIISKRLRRQDAHRFSALR